MKKIVLILSFFMCIMVLSSCGYNNTMYKYLSNIEHYDKYTIQVNDYYFYNQDENHYQNYNKDEPEKYIFEKFYFSLKELNGFHSGSYLVNDSKLSDHMVLLKLEYYNYDILKVNNFFEEYVMNDDLEVILSNWRYMDATYYYIIGVKYNNKEYLNVEQGLANVIKVMDENRSFI